MKQTNLLAILLLMVAGLQTSWAQKMIVRTTDSKTAKFNVSKVEDVVFTESEPINVGHKWVDLGLPSGTLWATCNIGASKPEEYGDCFAWGETEPKDEYNWSTYKWCNGTSNTITKYCTQSDYGYNGFTDGKKELDPEDDAAVVNWGIEWQMPSIDQIKELLNNEYTKTAWTTQNGVKGRLVRSKSNGNCIFLPAAGYCNGSNRKYAGSEGYYWSRSLGANNTFRAYDMDFDYDYINNNEENRHYGRSVRPVYVQNGSVFVTRITLSNTIVDLPAGGTYSLTATVQPEDATNKNLIWSSSDTGVATVDQAGNVTALANGVCTITCSAMDGSDVKAECQVLVMTPGTFGTSYGHGWIDLGLPSGTIWATCNVGASSPDEFGDYFAWGETSPKSEYSWSTYKWCNGSWGSLTKYCTDGSYGSGGFTDGTTELDPSDDAATVNWGSQWQMPSKEQRNELVDNCTREFIWVNGNRVARITGPNGNFILLPTALYYDGVPLVGHDENAAPEYRYCNGFYWTRSLEMMGTSGGTYEACCITFGIGTAWYLASYGDLGRNCGLSVRPVLATQSLNSVSQIVLSEIPVTMKSSETKQPVATDFPNDAENKNVALESSEDNEADEQTALTQKMVVRMKDNQTVEFNMSKLENVTFTDEEPTNDDMHGIMEGHEWIDLGLPSGTLWATCNVGASSPEEYGDYFAWGETKPKDYYDETTYFDLNDSGWIRTFNKYNNGGGKIELNPEDDAATANWGAPWRIPTSEQIKELCNNCSHEMIQQNSVNGILVTGPNGNTIFLPAAGYNKEDWLLSTGSEGYYWTSSLCQGNDFGSYYLSFGSSSWGVYNNYRFHGRSVRPVYVNLTLSASSVAVNSESTTTVSISFGFGNYTVSSSNESIATASIEGNTITITGIAAGTAIITVTDIQTYQTATVKVTVSSICPDGNHPHAIDLGLPSGIKWSCCNVGASKTEQYGDYFAWGETSSKSEYSWNTYKWCNGGYGTMTRYCTNNSYGYNGFTDGLTELLPEDDAATANWGNNWQMPSASQIEEILKSAYTTTEWTTQNGVNGRLITSKKNGNSIFLPAADQGSYGSYWSCSLNTEDSMHAYGLSFDSGNIYLGNYDFRFEGFSVRPIFFTLTLSASSVAVNSGSTTTVSITSGFRNHTVSSSNESIATARIDGNTITITGKAVGTAIITVTETQTHQTATVEVTVFGLCPDGNHPHAIDLGLPSGTKWSCCNVGASNAAEYGDYFAWGETEPKDEYSSSTYKWYNGSYGPLTKYCTQSDYGYNGFTDGKTELDPEDDAATANWGYDWQMPSMDQINELINSENTTTVWATQNGVYGRLITSKSNSNRIFLPAAGDRYYTILGEVGSNGRYWSRSLYTYYSDYAYCLYFDSSSFDTRGSDRSRGQSVRPIYFTLTLSASSVAVNNGSTTTVSITSGFRNYTVSSSNESIATASIEDNIIIITGKATGTAIITITDTQTHQTATVEVKVFAICPDGNHPHAIDLGLPSGTKWSCCNVGASSAEEYGDYFAWGETEPKDTYNWSTYKWMNVGQSSWQQINKYTFDDGQTSACWYDNGTFIGDNSTELDPEDDAATANWGSGWQMPSIDQINELMNNCTREWMTLSGVNGTLVTGPSGGLLFLPAAGCRNDAGLYYAGSAGNYWSRSLYTSYSHSARSLNFYSGGIYTSYYRRYYGQGVRPVCMK